MTGWIFTAFVVVGAVVVLRRQWQGLRVSARRAREAWTGFRRDSAA